MSGKTKLLRKIDERIATVGGGGVPGGGATGTPTAPAVPQPSAPQALTVVNSFVAYSALAATAVVNIRWRDPVSAGSPEKYQIQWADNSGFANATTREAARGQTTAAIDGLPVATLVYIRVRAIVRGVEGLWSSTVSTTTPDDLSAPAAPTGFSSTWDGVTGDLTIRWTNPTSRNLRDVRVRIFSSLGGSLLLEDASTVGRFVLPLSRNRQLSGGPRTSLYVVLTSRSVRDVLSVSDLASSVSISAPATPGSVVQSWASDDGTAAGNWRISWAAVSGARDYVVTIDGINRTTTDLYVDYPLAVNASEHSGAPDPLLGYSLVARNALGQTSTAASGSATNAAPPAVAVTATGVFSTIALTIIPSSNVQDLRDYRIRVYKDTVLQSGETFFTTELSPIYTVKAGSGSYTFDVTPFDVFAQAGTVSSLTSAQSATDITQFVADLRSGAIYSDSAARSSSSLFETLALDDPSTLLTFNSGGWVQTERTVTDRYGTITLRSVTADAFFYVGTSLDGVTWRWFARSGTFDGRNLVEVANEAAAQAATVAFSGITDGRTVALPAPGVDARIVRLYMVRVGDNIALRLFYPRRLVEADDIKAESITAVQLAAASVVADKIAAGAVTAVKISVSELSAITANMGTITAGTITGATIRTAASGQRVELTSANGLRGIDSGGVTQVQISPSTGRMITGPWEYGNAGVAVALSLADNPAAYITWSYLGSPRGSIGTFYNGTRFVTKMFAADVSGSDIAGFSAQGNGVFTITGAAGGLPSPIIEWNGTRLLFMDDASIDMASAQIRINSTQVLTSRRTGWGAPTGTATRAAFDTESVTLVLLARRVKALIDDLRTHGLIGN